MRKMLFILSLLLMSPAGVLGNSLPDYEKQAIALMEDCFKKCDSLPSFESRKLLSDCFVKVDDLLNASYKETLQNIKEKDAKLAELLRDNQRSWLKFSEHFCGSVATGFGEGGTMYLNFSSSAKLRLWVERIAFLRIVNRNVVSENSDN